MFASQKKYFLIIILQAFLFSACGNNIKTQTTTFSIQPENPKPGSKITVSYIADSTTLSGSKDVEMVIYPYKSDLTDAYSIKMKKNNSVWSADFTAADSVYGIIIKFRSGAIEDGNSGKGYIIKLHDAEGKILVGSELGLAFAIGDWGRIASMDRDREQSFYTLKRLLENNPNMKDEFFDDYLTAAYGFQKSAADSFLINELKYVENKPTLSKENLITLIRNYKRVENKEKSDKYTAILKDKYPTSEYLPSLKYEEFTKENNFDKKLGILKEYEKEYPAGENIQDMYSDLTVEMRDAGNYEKAIKFFEQNSTKIEPYYFYYTASKMITDKKDLSDAEKLLNTGIERGRIEVDNPTSKKPKTQSETEWKDSRKFELGMNLFALGQLLYDKNDLKEAAPKLEEAVALTKNYYSQQPLNELYVKTLYENGDYEKTMSTLEDFISNGDGTEMMTSLLKDAYIKKNGSDKGYNEYAKKYEQAAKEKMISDLKKEMLNDPAPNFTLKDLNGKDVSLSDYKGKIVIVDFWATWCGPCKKSFPGMKTIVENNSKNDSVNFLFINTFETAKDKKKNAADFLKSTGYPFHVLLDENNTVVQNYKVSGIPTKFVIDGKGRIRFKSIGFMGNTDALIEEVTAMISMAK